MSDETRPSASIESLREDLHSMRGHSTGLLRPEERNLFGAIDELAASRKRIQALEAALCWYGEQADALSRYLAGRKLLEVDDIQPIMAVVTALSVDAGGRASRAVLSQPIEAKGAMTWDGEVCKNCGQNSYVGFSVPDSVWEIVTGGGQGHVWCIGCFTRNAEAHSVPWADNITFFPASNIGNQRGSEVNG